MFILSFGLRAAPGVRNTFFQGFVSEKIESDIQGFDLGLVIA